MNTSNEKSSDNLSTGGRAPTQRDRGVSYALGFILIFSVLLTGTLALFVVGVDVLSEVDRNEAVTANSENANVIHSEVGDLTAQGATQRTMALELVDSQLGLTEKRVTLRIESEALPDIEYESRELVYEVQKHDVSFVYTLGHLYRITGESGEGVRSETPPVFDVSGGQTRLVVPSLVGIAGDGSTAIGVSGVGERELAAQNWGGESFTRINVVSGNIEPMIGTVTIVGTDHPRAWVTALESTGFSSVTRSDGEVTGEFETERLTVQQADIALDFGGDEP